MSRKIQEGMTIMVLSETKNMSKVDRSSAIDRARKWAWYEALHAKDRFKRAAWRAFESELTGATIALSLAAR